MQTKLNQLVLIFLVVITFSSCELVEPTTTDLYVHRCRSQEDAKTCDLNNDRYCECENSSDCERYCNIQESTARLSIGSGGRICGVIQGCIPPIDLRQLRIIYFTVNPAESSSVIRGAQTIAASSNGGNDIFAKGILEKYDKETKDATYKYVVINPDLADQELVIDVTAFITDEQGETKTLQLQTDPFPQGHFICDVKK